MKDIAFNKPRDTAEMPLVESAVSEINSAFYDVEQLYQVFILDSVFGPMKNTDGKSVRVKQAQTYLFCTEVIFKPCVPLTRVAVFMCLQIAVILIFIINMTEGNPFTAVFSVGNYLRCVKGV